MDGRPLTATDTEEEPFLVAAIFARRGSPSGRLASEACRMLLILRWFQNNLLLTQTQRRFCAATPPVPSAPKPTGAGILRARTYSAARKNGFTVRRAAAFAGKTLSLSGEAPQGLSPSRGSSPFPRILPSGAGRRPSSGSPPDGAVPVGVPVLFRTARYGCG